MGLEQRNRQAISLDLDGVVIGKTTPLIKTLGRYLWDGDHIFEPPSPKVYEQTEKPSDQKLNPFEGLYVEIVGKRKVSEDAVRFIHEVKAEDIYGNTGRPFKPAWVNVTESTLRKGGVRNRFTDVFYRPVYLGVKESKARVVSRLLKQYDSVIHIDDNPADALPLARAFPQIQVFIIQSLSGGILFSANEARNYPNVRRIASLGSIAVTA